MSTTASPAPRPTLSVHVALVVVQLAFGSLAVEGKLAMGPHGVSPQALAMARIAGGAVVFGVAHALSSGPRVSGWPDRLRLAALALFGIVLNQALFLRGLRETSPVAATLLVATIPVFSAVVAAIAGRDRITARSASGVAVAVLGIAVLSGFAVPRRGDALVIANAASYALYVVFAKGVLARYGTLAVVAWVFGWGALLFAPLGGPALVADLPTWSPAAAGLVAFVVLVPTVLAYSVNAWALRRATPSLVTVYIYLQPLVVVVLARVQLGQAIDLRTVVAAALILGGVGVVASAPRPASPDAEPAPRA